MFIRLPRRKQRVDGPTTSWLTHIAPSTRVARVGALGQGLSSLVHCPHPFGQQPGAGRRQAATSFDEGRPIEGEKKVPFKSLPTKNRNFSEPHEQVSISRFYRYRGFGKDQKGCGPAAAGHASHMIWFSARPGPCVFGLGAAGLPAGLSASACMCRTRILPMPNHVKGGNDY
jgi:hypothetical protein